MARRTLYLQAMIVAAVLVACAAALLAVSREAEAAYPGHNGRIAFCVDNNVYSVRPNGFGYRQETFHDGEFACEPSFSPDGTKLAFSSDQDGDYEIYVKNLASGQVTQITNDEEVPGIPDRRPTWSPDGTKLAFDDQNDVWVMDTDGSNEIQLTDTAAVTEWNAAWSPDGTKIAFVREDDVWVMDADGSDQKNLTRTPNLEDSYPSWSPNGRRIAWVKEALPDTSATQDVWKMNADGSGKDRLTFFAGLDGTPAWSPDGGKIAFIRDAEGDTDVWKMNSSDGSQKTNVTNNDFDEISPDWQPKPAP